MLFNRWNRATKWNRIKMLSITIRWVITFTMTFSNDAFTVNRSKEVFINTFVDEWRTLHSESGQSWTPSKSPRVHALLLQNIVLPNKQLDHSRLEQVQLRASSVGLPPPALSVLLLSWKVSPHKRRRQLGDMWVRAALWILAHTCRDPLQPSELQAIRVSRAHIIGQVQVCKAQREMLSQPLGRRKAARQHDPRVAHPESLTSQGRHHAILPWDAAWLSTHVTRRPIQSTTRIRREQDWFAIQVNKRFTVCFQEQ